MIAIRPPALDEWRACRMLLPDSFRGAVAPEAFLAWDDRAVAGAAAFHRAVGETTFQLTVVPGYRRRGVGTALLRRVCDAAAERGDRAISTSADLIAVPEAELFLAVNGFTRGVRMLRYEAELAPLRADLIRLAALLRASGRVPGDTRIADRSEAATATLVPWYEETAAPALHGRPGLGGYILNAPGLEVMVLLVNDRPAGLIAGQANDGGGFWNVDAVVVAPEYRAAFSWAPILLGAAAAERAWAAGSRRLRFATEETNAHMLAAIGRLRAELKSATAPFTRALVRL